ncbi:MAG: putative bifunctional diguanylate cyclase/phosphodiesterase [Betaproteobacteria bacterium]
MGSLRQLRDALACRLCWRITLAVFALILVVESAILVPSAQRFVHTELDRLADHAVIALEPALLMGGAGQIREIGAMVGQYNLAGLALYGRDGASLVRAGETEGLGYDKALSRQAGMMAERIRRSPDGRRTDIVWRSSRAGEPLVLARLDSAHIRAELTDYLLRIGGLVMVIVLVVTAGTMGVLHFSVLRPLMALRRSARAAGENPGHAGRHAIGSDRRDEMGDVLRAHDALLVQVEASIQRDAAMAEERARYVSHHDPLTGLPNRVALLEHLERAARAAGDDRAASLFLVNLRQFRELNASLGPRRADALLIRLAAGLREAVPAGEFVAHLGSDRFAISIVREAGGDDAACAERILRAAKEACARGQEGARVQIGVAAARLPALDAPTLIGQAEFALLRTGAEDTDGYQFYSSGLAQEADERQGLTRDLAKAIDAGELFPVFQPKLSLAGAGGRRIASAEVLLRWTSPSRGAVSPGRFIPLAETTGLIVPIGDFVLNAACAQMREWLDRHGWSPRLAVNLSAQQFSLPDLVERLQRALGEHRLAPDLLEIEVTETAAMRDVATTAAVLRRLRALGVHVSIDDFGSGYSSLLYLHRFAVDAIKIDRSFVESIGADHQGEAICDAVLRLGQALGTRVVAEGVETEAQLEFLRRRRCDEAQGYLIGRPVPAAAFESAWLAARAAA